MRQDLGDFSHTVPVSISLDDRHDLDGWSCSLLDGLEIACDLASGNFYPTTMHASFLQTKRTVRQQNVQGEKVIDCGFDLNLNSTRLE